MKVNEFFVLLIEFSEFAVILNVLELLLAAKEHPPLKRIILMDDKEPETVKMAEKKNIKLLQFEEVEDIGAHMNPKPDISVRIFWFFVDFIAD